LLQGKVALITGGSRGIGRAIATALAAADAKTYITGRDAVTLEKTANEIGATPFPCDHCNAPEVEGVLAEIKSHDGKLDILINNAGAAHSLADVDKLDLEIWRKAINLNLDGVFFSTHYALPLMPRGSIIVNNLSIAAKQPFVGMSAYTAAKQGALGFTNVLREELRPRGIRVVALIPGAIDTEIWNQFWISAPREKMMSPEMVAQAVLHAVTLPPEASLDELLITPSSGTL
jgi:NAD(P)-dependent dehydrogenase (short-subunit alcohol dehydrogenase family)